MSGKVTLVGAGTGDPSLITLKGLNALKCAEVVVFDRLIGDKIQAIIPENAEKIYVGKESGFHSVKQSDINKILLKKAQDGKNVVRLKGGDPFLFGRGGEELELLADNNIEFSVIPGVTSAITAPAYAGIPVTHREYASSLHIITGHAKEDDSLSVNYKSLVECGGTLVFLMGVSNMERITEGLIKNGMLRDTPCAVIENGGTSKQRKILGKLGDICALSAKADIKSPSVIVVGDVCMLSEKLDWFSKLPLKGKKIVITRPRERCSDLFTELSELGADVTLFPCVKTLPVKENMDNAFENIKTHKWIVFTSPSGVEIFFNEMHTRKKDARIFGGKKIAVIGSATSAQLEKYGIYADLIPDEFYTETLAHKIAENASGEKVLLLRSEDGSPELTRILESKGIEFTDVHTYKTVLQADENNREKTKNSDFVTFTSSSCVKGFAAVVPPPYDNFTAVCIGRKTEEEAKKHGMKTITAKSCDICSMVQIILGSETK